MINYIKDKKMLVIISILITILQVMIMLFQPDITSKVIENLNIIDASGNQMIDQEKVQFYTVIMIIIGVLGLFLGLVNTFIAAKISMYVGTKMRSDSFEKIQKFSYSQIEKFEVSHLLVRLTNDIMQVQRMVMQVFQFLIRIPLVFIGALIFSIVLVPELWWTTILFVLLAIVMQGIAMKLIMPKFKVLQNSTDNLNTIIKENVDGVRVIKSFVTEEKEEKRFTKEVNVLTKSLKDVGFVFSILIPAFTLTANLIIVLIFFMLSKVGVEQPEKISAIIAFNQYIYMLMFTIVAGGFMMSQAARAVVSAKRIEEINTQDTTSINKYEELLKIDSIEFKNVNFKYEGSESYSLKNISFKINRGEKIGIIGTTGSGKSTIVQLIPQIYLPTEGEILINGRNELDYSINSILSKISIVSQKANLFSGTIKDNILQGNNEASEEDLIWASEKAQAYEFINKKEGKFEADVYQKGSNFSGGQKQRISIARGLVSRPDLLILDDSTSALDAKSEKLVKEVIYNELNETTVIMVAQKISSIIETNKIIVVNEGKIESIGTHKELLKSSVTYKEIYETQKEQND